MIRGPFRPLLVVTCLFGALLVACNGDDDDAVDGQSEAPVDATEPALEEGAPTEGGSEPAPTDEVTTLGDDDRGLYVYSPSDGTIDQLANSDALGHRGVGLDWFPDGDSIAAFGASLLRVGLDGSSEVIHEPEDLVFLTAVSPDGELVAFSCSGPQSSDVCIVPAEPGSQLTRASEDEFFDYLIDWLDDERILILSDSRPGAPDIPVYEGHFPQLGGYFVLNTVDGNIVPATPDEVSDPWLSPDGEWTFELGEAPTYAFFSGTTGANIDVPIDAEDLTGIDPTALADQFEVAWSNDGAHAALVQRVVVDDGGFIRSAYNIWLVDLNGASVELIIAAGPCQTDLDCLVTADWSPDSSQLAILYGIAGD